MTIVLFLVSFWLLWLQSALKPPLSSYIAVMLEKLSVVMGVFWARKVDIPLLLPKKDRKIFSQAWEPEALGKMKPPEVMESHTHTLPHDKRRPWTWEVKRAPQKGYSVKLRQAELGSALSHDSIPSKLKRCLVKQNGPKLGWSPLPISWPYRGKL